jgi:hypothetical protein
VAEKDRKLTYAPVQKSIEQVRGDICDVPIIPLSGGAPPPDLRTEDGARAAAQNCFPGGGTARNQ